MPRPRRTPARRLAMGRLARGRAPALGAGWSWRAAPPRVRLPLRAGVPGGRRVARGDDRVHPVACRRAGRVHRPRGRRRDPDRARARPSVGRGDARRARRGHPRGRGGQVRRPGRAQAARPPPGPPAGRRLRHDGGPPRDRRAPATDPAGRDQPRAPDAAGRRPGEPRGDHRRRLSARPGAPRRRPRRDARPGAADRRPAHAGPVRGRARSPSTASRPIPSSWSPTSFGPSRRRRPRPAWS